MSREAELLAEIYAAPEDDAPRLVYADWLLERGDARGELIMLQCQRHQRGDSEPSPRESQLLAEHRAAWLGPLAAVIDPDKAVFRRGFVAECEARFESPAKRDALLSDPAWATVEKLASEPEALVHPGLTSLWSIGPVSGGSLLIIANVSLPRITELRVAAYGERDEELAWSTFMRNAERPLLVPNLERLEILHPDGFQLPDDDMRARRYDSRFRGRYCRGLDRFVLRNRAMSTLQAWVEQNRPRPDLARWAAAMVWPHYPRVITLEPCHGWTFRLERDEDRVHLRIDWYPASASGDIRALELALVNASEATFKTVHIHINGFERPHYRDQLASALRRAGSFSCSSRDR